MDGYAQSDLQHELRQNLFPWLFVPYIAAAAALEFFQPETTARPLCSLLSMAVLGLLALSWLVSTRGLGAAVWLLDLGSLGLIVLAAQWFPESGVEQALVFPTIMAAVMLGPAAAITTSGLGTLLFCLRLLLMGPAGAIRGSLITDLAVLWSTTLLICMTQRPQEMLIGWAWKGYSEARRNLEAARDRQVELKQALEDLALANKQTLRLNEMLTVAREAVEQARRAKEEFVARVSHELRTPLNMIIGFSDMILDSPRVYSRRLPASLLTDIAAMNRNSRHLADLVDDVLDLSECDTGHLRLSLEWTALQEITQEAVQAISALFAQKGLELTVDVPDDLPLVYCDRTRIRQVILNLLSNAGRFTSQGGATVAARREGDNIVINVTDTGPGIARTHLGHLFEPFQQEDPSIRRKYGGSGLGLAISKRLVELHGGKIQIDSTVGQGTTASFSLPVRHEAPTGGAVMRWFGPGQAYAVRTRRSMAPQVEARPRILVVEKGEALQQALTRRLQGLEVARVDSLSGARDSLRSEVAVGLVVNEAGLDATPDLLAIASEQEFDIPVLSCWFPDPCIAPGIVGVQEYLVKPVSRSDLLASIVRAAPQARSILLADDDPESRQLFRRMLESASQPYAILDAEDGEDTLRLMEGRHPDLLLLDLVMPNLDGFEVLERKRESPALCDIPVIIVSATDRRRQPVLVKALKVTRRSGLSVQDVALAVEATIKALKPQLGRVTSPGKNDG